SDDKTPFHDGKLIVIISLHTVTTGGGSRIRANHGALRLRVESIEAEAAREWR
ncbi:hypothetical protein JOB18_036653, partial [Solea senegalensis]